MKLTKAVYKVKDNDCCICAYAMAEGIGWKQSKRRLNKMLESRKTLGVSSKLVRRYGIKGYQFAKEGDFKNLNTLFNYGTGILFISFGNGFGHALFWDGCKFIDHDKGGRFHLKTDLDEMRSGETVNMALIKKKRGIATIIKSYILSLMN